MNELLQKHGCANVFSVPEGLKELMSDISREVLREQPQNILDFISNYLSALLITREHGIMAVEILDDLCDCRPSVSEHLVQVGLQHGEAEILSQIIKEEIEGFEPDDGKDKIREYDIMKKILNRIPLDEVTAAKVCQIARNAYRDYWYRKMTLEKSLKIRPKEPWEIAAQRTLEIYKRTKPSLNELTRATERIQAAYRGYHVRRNLLRHLKPKSRKRGPKIDIPGAPLDVGASREIDLGPLLKIKAREENISNMFEEHATESLGLQYDPMKTITHIPDEDYFEDEIPVARDRSSRVSSEVRRSRAPSAAQSQISEGKRHSRLPSQAEPRQSRIASQVDTVDLSTLKISFSEVPPEVFVDEEPEIPEEFDYVEAKEDKATENEAEDVVTEIPEDIPDDRADEGDDASAPLETMSSAPETANTTDVEDGFEELVTVTDEEEG